MRPATTVLNCCERSAVDVRVPAGRFEFGRGRRHGRDDLTDRGFEAVGELRHVRLALKRDAFFGVLLLFAVEAQFGLHGLHVSQRDANLVIPLDDDCGC
jgi:hypothetical protein